MTILEVENHTLRQRLREIEAELRSFKEVHARLVEANEELKGRIKVLKRQLHADTDGRLHERVDATFRVDGANSRVKRQWEWREMSLQEAPSSRRTSVSFRVNE